LKLTKAHLVPYQHKVLQVLAKNILQQEQASLPDLSSVTILLGDSKSAALLRRQLLIEAESLGHNALLGPNILHYQKWVMQYCPDNIKICDPQLQRLILVEALNENPDLTRSANTWALTDDLLNLFADLTLNLGMLPEHLDDFIVQLQNAYGIHSSTIDALGQEATLVYTLWHAWHVQLNATGLTDRNAAYLLALTKSTQQADTNRKIYITGIQNLYSSEVEWLKLLTKNINIQLFLHGQIDPSVSDIHPDSAITNLLHQLELEVTSEPISSPVTTVLNAVFALKEDTFLNRCKSTASQYPVSPLENIIQVYEAKGSDEEAHAVDVQVRKWLIDGHRRIGIVTENRKLARRVRALLERADIILNDSAGWALSTTSAAASLERWLECIEQDFAFLPLLDLLKSPFTFPQHATDLKQLAILHLEQDIVHQENIESNLQRYQLAIIDRANRLSQRHSEDTNLLKVLLEELTKAAAPLTGLQQSSTTAAIWLESLDQSLRQIGITSTFHTDQAGARVLQVIDEMHHAANQSNVALDWVEFRTWLGRSLEQTNFLPGNSEHDVHLLSLQQSCLQDFDAVILASAERDFLPGQSTPSVFFNDAVRKELDLTTSHEKKRARFYCFRRLLESAPYVLVTCRIEENSEPVVMSPWLEAIQSFHKLAWEHPLSARTLKNDVQQSESNVIRAIDKSVPEISVQPQPSIPVQMLDTNFSASGYQQLINCPYQYFAARCLKLAAKEELSTTLSKSDYGERIHLCLQALHSDVVDLPGPFKPPIVTDNREQAIQLLIEISELVFAVDVDIRIDHRGWLNQWIRQIPVYIDWQIERQQDWSVLSVEIQAHKEISNQINIRGQLDRVDQHQVSRAIIDYKTGSIPKEQDVLIGEAIQLPFYAALAATPEATIAEVAYLELENKGGVKVPFTLEGEILLQTSEANTSRLIEMVHQIQDGEKLPAWGDNKTCEYCTMNLLCRHQNWKNSND
jgi:ATP-dependent helicase/nuclease subunit B